jgi:hypothetical protein
MSADNTKVKIEIVRDFLLTNAFSVAELADSYSMEIIQQSIQEIEKQGQTSLAKQLKEEFNIVFLQSSTPLKLSPQKDSPLLPDSAFQPPALTVTPPPITMAHPPGSPSLALPSQPPTGAINLQFTPPLTPEKPVTPAPAQTPPESSGWSLGGLFARVVSVFTPAPVPTPSPSTAVIPPPPGATATAAAPDVPGREVVTILRLDQVPLKQSEAGLSTDASGSSTPRTDTSGASTPKDSGRGEGQPPGGAILVTYKKKTKPDEGSAEQSGTAPEAEVEFSDQLVERLGDKKAATKK